MRSTRRARLILALLALTALTLIALNLRGGGASPDGRLRSLAADVFGPVERGLADAFHPIGSAFAGLTQSGGDRAALARLREANAQLSTRLREQATDAHRLAQLEALLGLAASGGYRIVGAQVISYGSALGYEWTVGIDRGSAAGVAVGQSVLNGSGLVGRVVAVAAQTATVELAIDGGFVAGAELAPSGADAYTTGQGLGLLRLTVLDPTARLAVGEGVVTYPDRAASALLAPYLPIGQVVRLEPGSGGTTPSALVRPYVNFTALDYLGVVLAQVRPLPAFALLPTPAASPRAGRSR
jgi:rod shape-determining protein MreC